MKKTWFIIEKDFHRGPYTFEEIKNLKAQGKLNDNSLLWQEGNANGLTFAQARDVEQKITETLIPDVPGEFKAPFNQSEVPPLFPGEKVFVNEKFLKPTVETAKLDNIGKAAVSIEMPELTEQNEKTGLNRVVGIYFACLIGLVLFIGGGLFYFYIGRTPQLNFPVEMSKPDYERLSLVIDTRFVSSNIYELATAKDLSRLWLAINYPFPAELQLEMVSIPEMTWQRKSVKVRSKGLLENYLAEFKDFIIESEDGKFYPGLYDVKISLLEMGDVNLMSKLIYRNKDLREINIGKFFWGQGDKQEFLDLVAQSMPVIKTPEQKVVQEEEEIESEAVQILREKEEKFRTLLSLVNLADEESKEVFSLIETEKLLVNPKELKKALNNYEKKYLKEVAPLLTSIGQDDEVGEAKILGKHFVEILDSLRKEAKNQNNPKKKTKKKGRVLFDLSSFAQNHLLKFKELEANLEAKLKTIEDSINQQKLSEKSAAVPAKTN